MSGIIGGDAGLGALLLANQIEALLRAENERGGGENSGQYAGGRDDADGLTTVADGKAVSRVENMAIASPIDRERAEIIAGGGYGVIGQADGGPALARLIGFFQADVPGVFCGRMAGDADVLADV